MRRSPAPWLVLLLLVAACARVAAAQEPARQAAVDEARAVVARCAAEADPRVRGIAGLEGRCPGLSAALQRLGLQQSWIEGADAQIDAASLERLLAATRPSTARGPDPARLASVMAGMQGSPQTPSAWQRFKQWFERSFLARRDSGSFTWLTSWLERLTPAKLVRDILVWTLVVLVVGAAVVVVARELRASDLRWAALLRWRNRAPVGEQAASATGGVDEDWRNLDLAERPAALFRHVARQLIDEGRLPTLGSHTHRELRQRARLDATEQRDAWLALARAAERQIYAPNGVSEAEAQAAVSGAARIWIGRE